MFSLHTRSEGRTLKSHSANAGAPMSFFSACRSWSPALLAAIAFLAFYFGSSTVLTAVSANHLNLDGLYKAIFGWASFQTAFMFSIYGFVVAQRSGFIEAISRTGAMKKFLRSIAMAMATGFMLTFLSLPLIATCPEPLAFDVTYLLISGWACLFVLAFSLFCRVAYWFWIIVRVPPLPDIVKG